MRFIVKDSTPKNARILISGASIAGPALAFWLDKYGFVVTVVEKAHEVRCGGQAVDFKRETHRIVLERMGIFNDICQARAVSGGDGVVVDSDSRKIATIPAGFSGGEIEIARGDLARIIVERTAGTCEYLFGDSIASLTQTSDGVEVTFEQSAPRLFDLVAGADGIHSNVRKLAFGPESDYVRFLGYYYALADLKGNATGGPKAPAFFVFASERLDFEREDVGWRVPELMKQIPSSEEFYMDSISRVTVDRYSNGRIVLLGDSAYGNALGGFGTGLAIVGAYLLAGELHRSNGDYEVAYAQYKSMFRNYAKVSNKLNAGKLLAPATLLGLYARNRMFSVGVLFKGLMKLMDHFATDIELDDYAGHLPNLTRGRV